MLPALLFNNMENSSNPLNNSPNTSFYDESIILNSVRSRKKVTELPNCPICSCTIRQGELESHLSSEVERLIKLSNGGTKRKLSNTSLNSNGSLAVPGSSNTNHNEETIDVSGCIGSDVYQRVHSNRVQRLRSSRRSPPPLATGDCPVCEMTLPIFRLQKHTLRCLKKTGAVDDITTSEDESIDVENDSPSGGTFGAEYEWCGQTRVRATALQETTGQRSSIRRVSTDRALVVDGDEDTELYGPPQYSPTRIIPESETPPPPSPLLTADEPLSDDRPLDVIGDETEEQAKRAKNLVEASAETRIRALKSRIKELEAKQNTGSEGKCLICLDQYTSPAVSIQCWHVYCEICWLESLKAKKICPQCNAITTTHHLRRIYM